MGETKVDSKEAILGDAPVWELPASIGLMLASADALMHLEDECTRERS